MMYQKPEQARFCRFAASLFATCSFGFYHIVFYSESLFLFIYSVGIAVVFEHTLVQKKSLLDMPILKLVVVVIFLASNGFVRSTGFLAAAHLCYPILVDILRSFTTKHNLLLVTKRFTVWKRTKSLAFIVLISVAFLFPFGWIIKTNFSEYCRGEQPNTKHPSSFINWNTCKNDFMTSLKFLTTGPDFCPPKLGYYRIYDDHGQPSFCSLAIPNYYPWIQKRYWNVMFLSFVKLGQYENAVFLVLSAPVVIFFVFSQVKKILKTTVSNFSRKEVLTVESATQISTNTIQRIYDNFVDILDEIETHNIPIFVIMSFVGSYSLLYANQVSVDRILSSMPFYYIMAASFFSNLGSRYPDSVILKYFLTLWTSRILVSVISFSILFQPC